MCESGQAAGTPARTRGGCAGQSAPLHGPKTAKRLSSGRKPVAICRVWRSSTSRVKRIRGLCGGTCCNFACRPALPRAQAARRRTCPMRFFPAPTRERPALKADFIAICRVWRSSASRAKRIPQVVRRDWLQFRMQTCLASGTGCAAGLAPCAYFSLRLGNGPHLKRIFAARRVLHPSQTAQNICAKCAAAGPACNTPSPTSFQAAHA